MERAITEREIEKVEELAKAIVDLGYGHWARYGYPDVQGVVQPSRGSLEAASGLSVGTPGNTEPIARFNGYALPLELNVEFVTHTDPEFILSLIDEVRRSHAEAAELRGKVEQEKRVKLDWYHELIGCRERELHLTRETAELRERVGELSQALSDISMWIPASISAMTVEQLVIWFLTERALTGEAEIPDSVSLKEEAMKRYELVHSGEDR